MLKLWLPHKTRTLVACLQESYIGESRRRFINKHRDVIFGNLKLEAQEASKLYAHISGKKPVSVHFI